MGAPHRCAGRHRITAGQLVCPSCRFEQVIAAVEAVETSLPRARIAAAVRTVVTNPAVLRNLAAALATDPDALSVGAPPVVGRLVDELIAAGSTVCTPPVCRGCARRGLPLFRGNEGGGLCKRCRAWQIAEPCADCGKLKPVTGRGPDGTARCEVCRRRDQARHRRCGVCGALGPIALRAGPDTPEVCVSCYRLPTAVCQRCGRLRPCVGAAKDQPICRACLPRATATCARCGQDRPPAARWAEGPLCDPCYGAALRRRGQCVSCGQRRRLVAPPGPHATNCADCAGLPVTHACTDCGVEDKMFEKGRCDRCSLRRRVLARLGTDNGAIPPHLAPVAQAIIATSRPKSALNWLRTGAAAAVLADLAAGHLALSHQALDDHPQPRAADYLRHMLTAHGVLPARDEQLIRTQQWLDTLLATITEPDQRRLVKAFATWHVMRRLRRGATAHARARTYTAHARLNIKHAAGFLAWLAERDRALAQCRQTDLDAWLTSTSSGYYAREFLCWAADHGHCQRFTPPRPARQAGTASDPDQRWEIVSRLLHDKGLHLIDRVAGCMVLLFGQQQSKIAEMTTNQISQADDTVTIRLGRHDIPVPDPLGDLLLRLIRDGKTHIGIGSPTHTRWLFPGGLPGRPISASRLAERLRAIGIPTRAARRAALTDLAAQLPAAVLADLLGLHPTTAVKWMNQAGADWSRYAAELARDRNHQPRGIAPSRT
jgi:hypothetical protein